MNYYNEFDPKAAAWLRNLIAAGLIPAGDVDERSIEDVIPNELRGYTQCHFFAGIGGWPLALALAGWPADRPVWTGSCPCQPFSAAGKGAGFADERHLWPAWQHLIAQCRPPVIFGEQVASKAVDPWIDLVHADLEGMGYAFGCNPFPAAGVGAPHIRDRTYWLADANVSIAQQLARQGAVPDQTSRPGAFGEPDGRGDAGGVGDTDSTTSERRAGGIPGTQAPLDRARVSDGHQLDGLADASQSMGGLANVHGDGCEPRGEGLASLGHGATTEPDRSDHAGCGPTNGQWGAADWLACTDGKWRPVEPGSFPLAHGIPGRVGRLRAYGNAIVPAQAAEYIGAYIEARGLTL